MRSNFIKLALVMCQFAFFSIATKAQYTETFESQTPYVNYFNSNGQQFTLTNEFLVFSSRAGFGYQHSNRFVDNGDNVATNQTNAIKTTDASLFNIKSLWVYLSKDGGNNPSTDGSIIITGKLGGVVQFSITKAAGFSTSFVPDNGFTFINFSTEGGINNSNISIDEIEFHLQGNFNYIAIENFTWAPTTVLPLSLLSYTATLVPGGKVKLSWHTALENSMSHFIVSKSRDGRSFQQVNTLPATGNSSLPSSYALIDDNPFTGINYYRLEQVDVNGKIKNLGIKTILLANRFYKPTVFPNPSTGGSITLRSEDSTNSQSTYFISDLSGRVVKKGNIISQEQPLNISSLSAGNYNIVLSNGEVIKWVKN